MNVSNPPVIARHRLTGTEYTEASDNGTGVVQVTTLARSKYLVRADKIEYIQPTRRNPRQELEKELQQLAEKLGGGWRIEKGIMPVVVLTLEEAREAAREIEKGRNG